jgi:hypothetical protein
MDSIAHEFSEIYIYGIYAIHNNNFLDTRASNSPGKTDISCYWVQSSAQLFEIRVH